MTTAEFASAITIVQDAQDARPGQDAESGQEAPSGNSDGIVTPYDSVWANSNVPTQQPSGLEAALLKEDKLYTVLAVVLIIWFGILFFIARTDRKLDALENQERQA